MMNQHTASSTITTFSGIVSRVKSHLHEFAQITYYDSLFAEVAESIFEKYKRDVDLMLGESYRDAIEAFPSIYDRLSENEPESISAAMNTCRRLLAGFADRVYPPVAEPIIRDGAEVKVGKEQYLNRITEYIRDSVSSEKRRTRLRQSARNLNERLSAGVHDDVSADEARSLMLSLYLLMGELVELQSTTEATVPVSEDSSVAREPSAD